ncbi:MAG: TRAP transporter substrate-binding protein [Pseudomonadota bacterium]
MKKWFLIVLALAMAVSLLVFNQPSTAQNPMDAWKPGFDPSGAKYKIVVSNVSHPAIKGVYTGFAIRDELWARSKGQMYFDYRPFSQLGGEVEVLNLLQSGAIQGMSVSSVASTNLGPRMGVVNLPFLVNDYDKMEKFAGNEKMFQHFLDGMKHQGIIGVNVSSYGQYGWATTKPVRNIADAKAIKFRIAEAAVNKLTYQSWGLNPVVMPWPDVPVALKQGVIEGLDHTAIVCNLTKKFEVCKYFTELNYAQGLFIWIYNEAWFKGLPEDLGKILLDVTNEQCTAMRAATKVQQDEQIADAKGKGIEFIQLSAEDLEVLRVQGKKVHEEYAKEIGPEFLKEVQDFLGFK